MSKKQVTFAEIAEYTNFSKTTISRYFNHPDSLTVENQEKISQALDTLGYKKNKLAKVLAKDVYKRQPHRLAVVPQLLASLVTGS